MATIELTKVVIRTDGNTNELNLAIPAGTDDSGIREIVAEAAGISLDKFRPLRLDREDNTLILRDEAPWG